MCIGSKVRVKELVLDKIYGDPSSFWTSERCSNHHMYYSNKVLTIGAFNNNFILCKEASVVIFHKSMVDIIDDEVDRLINFIHNNFLKA